MTQKETLWIDTFLIVMNRARCPRDNEAKEEANKAVDDFEKRFGKSNRVSLQDIFEKDALEYIESNKDRYTIPKFDIDKKDVDPSFTQAGRLKRLFEELDIAVECGSDEDESFIMVLDWVFHFKNGAFKNVKVI